MKLASLEVSADSQFIYAGTGNTIHQIDIEAQKIVQNFGQVFRHSAITGIMVTSYNPKRLACCSGSDGAKLVSISENRVLTPDLFDAK